MNTYTVSHKYKKLLRYKMVNTFTVIHNHINKRKKYYKYTKM